MIGIVVVPLVVVVRMVHVVGGVGVVRLSQIGIGAIYGAERVELVAAVTVRVVQNGHHIVIR